MHAPMARQSAGCLARQRCCHDGLRSAEGDRLQRALDCLPHFIHRVSMFKHFLHSTQGTGKWFLVKWPTPQSLSHIGPVITQGHVKMNQRRGAKVCDGRRPDHGLKPVAHNKHRGLRGEQPESSHEQTSSQTAHQAAQLMCFARLHCFSSRQAGSRRAVLVRVITPQGRPMGTHHQGNLLMMSRSMPWWRVSRPCMRAFPGLSADHMHGSGIYRRPLTSIICARIEDGYSKKGPPSLRVPACPCGRRQGKSCR